MKEWCNSLIINVNCGGGIGGRGIGFAFPWLLAAGALAKFKL